jgi:hypothetical protein
LNVELLIHKLLCNPHSLSLSPLAFTVGGTELLRPGIDGFKDDAGAMSLKDEMNGFKACVSAAALWRDSRPNIVLCKNQS